MKILVTGDFHSEIHEKAFCRSFSEIGHEVHQFSWSDYFKGYPYGKEKEKNVFKSFYYRFQNKFLFGPVIDRINKDLLVKAKQIKPDLIFIYRGTHIYSRTILELKNGGVIIFGYNNDDPFGKNYPKYFWHHFKKSIPYYDHIFAYRGKNIEDYRKIGFNKVGLLRSYYIKEKNFNIENLVSEKYVCNVIFVGHYENDGRDELIKRIIDEGIDFKLFGSEWRKSKYYNIFKNKFGEIRVLEEDYNLALNSAKIDLVFLSNLNNDTYTRRCFEIIAAKKFMLSDYSDDLNSMFESGKEADYFKNSDELIEKIKYYLANNEKREEIAKAGYNRLIKDRHEVIDRAKEVINVYNKFA